jgi:hypothetical protein
MLEALPPLDEMRVVPVQPGHHRLGHVPRRHLVTPCLYSFPQVAQTFQGGSTFSRRSGVLSLLRTHLREVSAPEASELIPFRHG